MTEHPEDLDEAEPRPIEVDGSVSRPARVYDYVLGGRDHFAADRATADGAVTRSPGGIEDARASVRAERAFVGRVIRYLVGEVGIRQILDVGTGIPSDDPIHAIAQKIAPETRVAYVDEDAVVLAHAHTLRRSTAEGAADYIDGELRDPATILRHAARTLDLSRPVAVTLFGILHHFRPEDRPYEVVSELLATVPPGSYLAVTHLTADILADLIVEAAERINQQAGFQLILRTHGEVARFFAGLDLVEPGVVQVDEWHPDPGESATRGSADAQIPPYYGGVGRKV